jgi:ABC-type sugar transport system permease subunit
MRSYKIDSAVMRVALGLFLAAAMSVIVQHVLVGQLTLRQYLFLPLVFFWMAILVLFSGAVVARSGRAIFLLLPLVAVFIFAAAQNFRDPFQENPRQGGTGRYASEDLWRPALEKARVACESLEEDEVVVVSQFDPESPVIKQMIKTSGLKFAWFDHPFVARCYVINGG